MQSGDDDYNETNTTAFHPENNNTFPVNLNPEIPNGLVQAMNSISRPMPYALGGGGPSGSDDLSMRTFRQLRSTITARAQNSIEVGGWAGEKANE